MKLIITKGLPGSGKTHWSKEQIDKNHGNYKRINRDDLRNMIDNDKWSKNNEKFIKSAQIELARMFLNNNKNVIVDDTNLSQKTVDSWRDFAKSMDAEFEIKDFTDVPLTECIKRDQKRPNYVGEKVIKRMYNEFLSPPTPRPVHNPNLPNVVVTDLDSTLALHNGRSPYDGHLCESDTLNESVWRMIQCLYDSFTVEKIIIVSGRPGENEQQTRNWLSQNKVFCHHLYMRGIGDKRPDDVVKEEIYNNYIKDKYNVIAWFDDRLRVCRVVHKLGLPLFRVGDPELDF